MLTFSRYVQAILCMCLPSTSGLTLNVSNTWDGGTSFKTGSTATLTCRQQPYSGIQNWTVDSVTVHECIFSTCGVKKASDPKRYLFRCDTTSGRFAFTIHPVKKTDNGKVIGCYDGHLTRKITLIVTGNSNEGSSVGTSDRTPIHSVAWVVPIAVSLSIGCLITITYSMIRRKLFLDLIGCRNLRRQKRGKDENAKLEEQEVSCVSSLQIRPGSTTGKREQHEMLKNDNNKQHGL